MVSLLDDPEQAILSAEDHAASAPASGWDWLVVIVTEAARKGEWPARRGAAVLHEFTRYAALAWAPRRIRINTVVLGAGLVDALGAAAAGEKQDQAADSVAGTILGIGRWRSMTGQSIHLRWPGE